MRAIKTYAYLQYDQQTLGFVEQMAPKKLFGPHCYFHISQALWWKMIKSRIQTIQFSDSDNFSQCWTCISSSQHLSEVVSAAQKNQSSLLLLSCRFCNTLKSGSKLYYIIVMSLGFLIVMVVLTKNLMLGMSFVYWIWWSNFFF